MITGWGTYDYERLSILENRPTIGLDGYAGGSHWKRKLFAMERKTEAAEDEVKTERRKAWEAFIANNRKRKIHVDQDVDISRLCDEMNDMETGFERQSMTNCLAASSKTSL